MTLAFWLLLALCAIGSALLWWSAVRPLRQRPTLAAAVAAASPVKRAPMVRAIAPAGTLPRKQRRSYVLQRRALAAAGRRANR